MDLPRDPRGSLDLPQGELEVLQTKITNLEEEQQKLAIQIWQIKGRFENVQSDVKYIESRIHAKDKEISGKRKTTEILSEVAKQMRACLISPKDERNSISWGETDHRLPGGTEARPAQEIFTWMAHEEFQTVNKAYSSIRLSWDFPKTKGSKLNHQTSSDKSETISDGSDCTIETWSHQSIGKRTYSDCESIESNRPQPKRAKSRVGRQNVTVAFTRCANLKKLSKTALNLGGSVVKEVQKATVLVTSEFLRTIKLLMAITRGVPIVSLDWLNESETAACFLDPWKYLLRDPKEEERYQFNLDTSLIKAKRDPLLKGYSIFVTKNVQPSPKTLKGIIASCGGTFLERPPPPMKRWPSKTVIIGSEEDASDIRKLKNRPIVVSCEWILNGILTQKLKEEKYQLPL